MATTAKTEPRAAEVDATPEDRARDLLRKTAAEADRARKIHDDAMDRLAAVRDAIAERREAEAAHVLARIELTLLVDAFDLDVDVPAELDREDVREDVESALESAHDARTGETRRERIARSARTCFGRLRTADGPDDVRRRVRQLRDRLDDPAWLTDEVAEAAWIRPAERRRRKKLRRSVVRRALRWANSAWRGHVPGDPRDAFPMPVADVLEEWFETGALAPGNGPWAVPRRWYPPAADLSPGELAGRRDLRGEIEDAVAGLPASAVEEAAP